MSKQRRAKYGNVRTTIDGISFASKREAERYGQLKILERAGEVRNLRLQVPFPLRVAGELVCTYVADFAYEDRRLGWTEVVEDAKGVRTREYAIKRKLMRAVHGVEIREV